jgi:hypothetical protein
MDRLAQVWIQLSRWSFDKLHIELIGRQSQLTVPANCNLDQLIRLMVHDDAYKDECHSLGLAKIRAFRRCANDTVGHIPLNEIQPYEIMDGIGTDGRDPIVVVTPGPEYPLSSFENMNFDMFGVAKKPKTLEDKRRQDRVRQQRCRARKKVESR